MARTLSRPPVGPETQPWHREQKLTFALLSLYSKDYIQLILAPDGEFIFFQCRSGPFIPTLRLLHRCAPRQSHRTLHPLSAFVSRLDSAALTPRDTEAVSPERALNPNASEASP